MNNVPIAVVIPTCVGRSVDKVIERIRACDPQPVEIIVHLDPAPAEKEQVALAAEIRVLNSSTRLGPGGARHRCLLECTTPYAVSFDDDSYPTDTDFFGQVFELFSKYSEAAIFGANIWHRQEPTPLRSSRLILRPSYVGCGYAVRLEAYREVRGHIPRPLAYGIEESDLSLQLFEAGWKIYEAGALRVFHDTDLKHHNSPGITSATIANIGLNAFLNYPVTGWGRGLVQVANKIVYCIKKRRTDGIISGVLRLPADCYRYRGYRRPIQWRVVKEYLRFCRLNTEVESERKKVTYEDF